MKKPCHRVLLLLVSASSLFCVLNLIPFGTFHHADPERGSQFRRLGPDFYVYSAYAEPGGVLKVIAMRRPSMEEDSILCTVPGMDVEVTASVHEVLEKRRSAYFVPLILTCDFSSGVGMATSHLELSRLKSFVQLKITHPSPSAPKYQLSRCLPILYGSVDLGFLRAILAINTRYGVDHFQLYAHPGAYARLLNDTSLHEYSITLKMWDLPIGPFQVWYYGQLVLLQDCLYSSRAISRRVLIGDMDEYLLPLDGILDDAEAVSAWNFATVPTDCCPVRNLSGTPDWILTKYVVRPNRVKSLGVHKVHQFEDRYTGHSVNASDKKAVIVHCRQRCYVT